MPRALERSESRRDNWLFTVCLVLSVLALFAPAAWGVAAAASLRATALRPLVWLQARAAEGRTSRARMDEAVRQRDSLAELVRTLAPLGSENDQLRRLLALGRRLGPGFVAAEVLRQTTPTDGRTLLLDAGAADGVRAFDPVITAAGLVGVVRDVDASSSIAMTWAHPEFRVSVTTADGEVAGIVGPTAAGEASRTGLEFRAVTYRDTVPMGTPVVASGLGGVYPRGVPVGTVAGVEREQMGWERVYRLDPATRPGALTHVLILTAPARPRATGAFSVPAPAGAADSVRAASPPAAPSVPSRARRPPAAAARPAADTGMPAAPGDSVP